MPALATYLLQGEKTAVGGGGVAVHLAAVWFWEQHPSTCPPSHPAFLLSGGGGDRERRKNVSVRFHTAENLLRLSDFQKRSS